MSGLTALGFVS